jgi:urocanate hydratase
MIANKEIRQAMRIRLDDDLCLAGKAFQLMIDNNLDFDVALYPYELVTYGETGSVCQNWMQYRLIKKYLRT